MKQAVHNHCYGEYRMQLPLAPEPVDDVLQHSSHHSLHSVYLTSFACLRVTYKDSKATCYTHTTIAILQHTISHPVCELTFAKLPMATHNYLLATHFTLSGNIRGNYLHSQSATMGCEYASIANMWSRLSRNNNAFGFANCMCVWICVLRVVVACGKQLHQPPRKGSVEPPLWSRGVPYKIDGFYHTA